MKKNKTFLTYLGAALLFSSLYSCSSEEGIDTSNSSNSTENVLAKSAYNYEEETNNFIENFYDGNYEIVNEETIISEEVKFHVSSLISNGVVRGYIIKDDSQNKVVFADKNEDSKILTYFDMSFPEHMMELDYSHIDESETNSDNTVYSKPGSFLGFNFRKFFGHSRRSGSNTYEIEPGSCYRNCVDTYVILGLEFQNGSWGPCPC